MHAGIRIVHRPALLSLLVVGILSSLATQAAAQTATQIKFFRNYIVTGDYVVGGVGLRGKGDNTGYAPGTIHIPDVAQNASDAGVPAGADIVAAYLYWQTVEKSKSALAGKTGFFNGHAIIGVTLGDLNAPVSWSSGGCAGSANGTTTLRTYRADVRPFLNVVNGVAQGNADYPVRLADSGSNGGGAPLTLGATLVLIYRVPRLPLTAVTLYDGAYAPGNGSLPTTETLKGFYEPTLDGPNYVPTVPSAKLTHIVGNGQPNKLESVALSSLSSSTTLPSLYGSQPPFPGFYNGSWDNPTWTDLNQYTAKLSPLLVRESIDNVTTTVTPSSSNTGCVSWGAMIFSTTVQDTDKDGLLDKWESAGQYTDPNNETVLLPGASPTFQDIYVQMDWLANTGASPHSHILKEDALNMVGKMFSDHNISLHVDCHDCYPGSPYVIHGSTTGGNVIDESVVNCTDNTKVTPASYCAFPGVSTIGWKGAFTFWRNQPLNYPNELQCVQNPGTCVRRFQHARKDSYHEVIFGHALALATTFWTRSDGSLLPIVVTGNSPVNGVVSSGIATITTSTPNGLSKGDRVTISGAVSPASASPVFGKEFALNGTYLVASIPGPNNSLLPNSFTVGVLNMPVGTYDTPGLYVSTGPARSTSGWSDQRGADTLVTLGLWRSDIPADDQVGSVLVQAGTFAHELGHTLGLSHGGADGTNCKSNFQSVMNYLFQTRGLIAFDGSGAHVDYSDQTLPLLNENSLNEPSGIGAGGSTYMTRWYAPFTNNFIDKALSALGGRAASRHCDGTPITDGAQMVRMEGPATAGSIDWNNDGDSTDTGLTQDISFNGVLDPVLAGSNDWDKAGTGPFDWTYLDLQQIGARRGVFGFSGDIWGSLNDGSGGSLNDGSGGSLNDGSGGSLNDGAGGSLNDGSGGSLNDGAGGSLNDGAGGSESDFNAANTTVDPASGLTGAVTKKSITLNWTAPNFGQIRTYYIWRADITKIPMSAANPPVNIGSTGGASKTVSAPTTFPDTTIKGGATYIYFVSAALGNDSGVNTGNQSGASNMIKCDVNVGTCVPFP